MTYLPDVNVWIALVAERSVHHDAARRWFAETEPEVLVFCRITQLGVLRLLTNRHVMQKEVLSPEVAWAAYRDLRKNPADRIPRGTGSVARGMGWVHLAAGGISQSVD
jgi:toxin-antitoxin system PIN domain toxin